MNFFSLCLGAFLGVVGLLTLVALGERWSMYDG